MYRSIDQIQQVGLAFVFKKHGRRLGLDCNAALFFYAQLVHVKLIAIACVDCFCETNVRLSYKAYESGSFTEGAN